MNAAILWGAALAIAGGALQGAFAVPMKYAKKWNHENIWFLFVLTGMVIFPWIITLAAVPSLAQVYRAAPWGSLLLIAACGIGWGVGATLVGIAFRMMGIGLGFAIVLGLGALLGSLVPFLLQSPQGISTAPGRLYLLGTLIMLAGIAVVAVAGAMRDRAGRKEGESGTPGQGRFAAGLAVAIAAGVLSSLLSDAIAFTSQMVETARQAGASPVWASNVVLAPATTGGFLANCVYCVHMMRRNHSAKLFRQPGVGNHWLFGIAMGAFWYGGLAVYGFGEQKIGSVNGWPLFIGAMILSSSAAGFLTGEWRAAGRRAKAVLCAGSLLIFSALIVVGMAHNA
jgi:L-rhamnose-H+ transport protein